MTRNEITKLLEFLCANYPHAKIKDAAKTADAWEMVFGTHEAEAVFKAARLHVNTSKFFPTPADVLEKVTRAGIVYGEQPANAIEAPKASAKEDYYLEELCKFVGLGYPEDDNADLLCEFLPYEK